LEESITCDQNGTAEFLINSKAFNTQAIYRVFTLCTAHWLSGFALNKLQKMTHEKVTDEILGSFFWWVVFASHLLRSGMSLLLLSVVVGRHLIGVIPLSSSPRMTHKVHIA